MLSFNFLGNLGRLANQMFQYASLKGIAIQNGYEFCIPPKEIFGKIDPMINTDMNLYDVFSIDSKNNIGLTKNNILQEKSFSFDDTIFSNCPNSVDLRGYYQTEKYFKHIENQIREDFTFTDELKLDCTEFINSLNSEVISIHIRRGDYVINKNHPVQSIKYYQKALNLLPKDIPVLVFSDDFDWCSNQKLFDGDRFMISEKSSVDADLCMMSLCDYHVIANSSFSWWGAWLAKSKKTIAPKKWFGPAYADKDTKDLYCDGWIIL